MSPITLKAGFVAAFLFLTTTAFAETDFPLETQTQLLNARIAEALQRKDNPALIAAIEQYRKLARFPRLLLVTEAQAAKDLGDSERALAALNEYLKSAHKGDENYDAAIQLYPKVEIEADTNMVRAFLATLRGQMRVVPAGRFLMGTDFCANLNGSAESGSQLQQFNRCVNIFFRAKNHGEESAPAHWVTVPPFKMQATTVDWRVVKAFDRESAGNNTSDYDLIQDFIAFVNKTTHHHFRLPTEAEWEYAMVSGTGSSQTPWNNCGDQTRCHDQDESQLVSRPANAFGISSRADEIVSDCWHANFMGAPTDGSAWDPMNCPSNVRTLRHGGSNTVYARGAAPSPEIKANFRLVEAD